MNPLSIATSDTPGNQTRHRSQPGAPLGRCLTAVRADADPKSDAACHTTGLEIGYDALHGALASNTPGPDRLPDHPYLPWNDKSRLASTVTGW